MTAGTDGTSAFAFALVHAVDLILRALGHGEEVVRRVEIAAERRGKQLAAHAVHLFDRVADGPDADIHVATGTHCGVGHREELANPVPPVDHFNEGSLVGGALCSGKAAPLWHDLVEREGDDLPFDRRAAVGRGPGGACRCGCCCRRDGVGRLGGLGCFGSRGLCHNSQDTSLHREPQASGLR